MSKREIIGFKDEKLSKNVIGSNEKSVSWKRGRLTVTTSSSLFNKKTRKFKFVESSSSFNVVGLIIAVLLLIAVSAILHDDEPKSFMTLLETLSAVPEVKQIDLGLQEMVLPDWGAFNFLHDFIFVFFLEPTQLLLFITTNILQVLVFLFYILRWLF